MTNQQKGLVLVGLFVAWGGLSVYQMSDSSESSSTDNSSTLQQTNSRLPSVKDLSLDQSFPNSRQIVTFSQPRNIFAPLGLRKVVAKQKTPITQTSSRPTSAPSSPASPPGPSPSDLAAQRARQQLNKFRFLGYLTKGGESQAFLTNGQAIYIVKQGEMMEGQVQVNKIEPETIVLSTQVLETGNQVQATIPLTPET
jgi:Tfp pilus assembly protein PilP